MKTLHIIMVVVVAAVVTACSDSDIENAVTPRTPEADTAATLVAAENAVPENPLKDAYFGETHVHTALSFDALIGMIGDGIRTPDDAYRLAKGETLKMGGQEHSIGRPLDFTAVTDHAEYIGESYSTITPGAPGHDSPDLISLRAADTPEKQLVWYTNFSAKQRAAGGKKNLHFYAGAATLRSGWQMVLDAAANHYDPGTFTTFAGFEWSTVVKGGNLHRNVIFRDMTVPLQPYSAIDSSDETELWAWMAEQEANGSTLFAIPHNSNAGKGLMFPATYPDGTPIDADYAAMRNRYERSIEIMQVKGNSEVHRQFWPNDEFADFENADSMQNYSERTPMKNNFVRWGLIEGLAQKAKLGTNPFQLGIIGATDNHNGAPADVVESNFIGSHGPVDSTPELRQSGEIPPWLLAKDENPGAIAGVWATKNTRGAIYDAMYERETFATSGPRMKIRLYAGADLSPNPTDATKLVTDGYAKGVPMGGNLGSLGNAPTLTVYAEKDSIGANLDRIQIIKGWVDSDGEHQERIINVVWSGDRTQGTDGQLAAVGSTVDVQNATYDNSIGVSVLMGSWTDDEFDPARHALYYARVLEIPTPRWSTYDAVRNNLPLLNDVSATIQERAWTSPIWYSAD